MKNGSRDLRGGAEVEVVNDREKRSGAILSEAPFIAPVVEFDISRMLIVSPPFYMEMNDRIVIYISIIPVTTNPLTVIDLILLDLASPISAIISAPGYANDVIWAPMNSMVK